MIVTIDTTDHIFTDFVRAKFNKGDLGVSGNPITHGEVTLFVTVSDWYDSSGWKIDVLNFDNATVETWPEVSGSLNERFKRWDEIRKLN